MAARQNYYAESTGESSTALTALQDKVSLTFTPDASASYFLLWSALFNTDSTNGQPDAVLFNSTSSTVLCQSFMEPHNIADYVPIYGLAQETFGASPASQTYKIQYENEVDSAATKIKEARIIALKADAADQYAASDGTSSQATSTFQTKTTLTFTPASTGDYLIIAFAEWQFPVSGTPQIEVELDLDGTTQYGAGNISRFTTNATVWSPWGTIVKVNLSNASHTFTIKYRNSDNTNTVSIRNARIAAIRLDTLDNNYYAESRANANTTSASYQDSASVTATPAAVSHLILGCAKRCQNATTSSALTQLADGSGSIIAEATREGEQASTSIEIPDNFFQLIRRTESNSSTTWKVQYHSGSAGVRTDITEAAVAALQLDATPASYTPRMALMGMG